MVVASRRYGHEPFEPDAGQGADLFYKFQEGVRVYAALLGLAANVYLHQHPGGKARRCALAGDFPGKPLAVYRLDAAYFSRSSCTRFSPRQARPWEMA